MPCIHVVAAIIIKDQKILIAQRPAGKHKGGYWEFPGGKIEKGETAEQALCREIKEEIDIDISATRSFTEIHFNYPEKSVHLQFFEVTAFSGKPKGLEGQLIRWVSRAELLDYQFPEANLVVVSKLQCKS